MTQVGDGYLYVDDGSHLRDGTYTNGNSYANTGVRVAYDPSGCDVGDYLSVTGISSCFKVSGGLQRVINARSGEDIAAIR